MPTVRPFERGERVVGIGHDRSPESGGSRILPVTDEAGKARGERERLHARTEQALIKTAHILGVGGHEDRRPVSR
jgi:hypothetical protein